jgi:hypothetical protein
MVPTWGSTDLPGWFHLVPPLPATLPSHQVHGSYMGFHRPTRIVSPSSSSPSNSTFSPCTWFLHGVPQTYQGGSTPFLLSQQLYLLTRYMVHTWGSTDLLGLFHPDPPLLATLPSHQVHGSSMGFHRPTKEVPPSSSSPSNFTFSPGTWFLHAVPLNY